MKRLSWSNIDSTDGTEDTCFKPSIYTFFMIEMTTYANLSPIGGALRTSVILTNCAKGGGFYFGVRNDGGDMSDLFRSWVNYDGFQFV